jgi:uncharacterized protein
VEFEWDADNVEHIAEHGVSPDEVEEALADTRRFPVAAYNTPTERRRAFVGATDDGRLLFIVYTLRTAAIRVVTARDASDVQRRTYRQRRGSRRK